MKSNTYIPHAARKRTTPEKNRHRQMDELSNCLNSNAYDICKNGKDRIQPEHSLQPMLGVVARYTVGANQHFPSFSKYSCKILE